MSGVHVIIQARWNSSRLPGKVGEHIGGLTALEHVYLRARKVTDYVSVAVPASDEDWRPPQVLESDWWPIPGDENDLIRRFALVARRYPQRNLIIRLTADCPWVPVSGIEAVADCLKRGAEYCETRSDPSSRPNGIDVQGFTLGMLAVAASVAIDGQKEHVTGALMSAAGRPEMIDHLEGISLDDLPPWRMTLDTPEDLAWFRMASDAMAWIYPPYPRLVDLLTFYEMDPSAFRMDT